MTTHVPMARVPFAPLDNPRLQHLANAKNRQNGISALASDSIGKSTLPLKTVTKRDFSSTFFEDADFDSENIDPASLTSPSKKSKNSNGFEKPVKPFAFTFFPTVKPKAESMAPPPTVPSRLSTPIRANMSSPRAPMTAPAGRSPNRKTTLGGISKPRRVSAPFTRIDPPSFTGTTSSGLPFSLDAALSGTLSSPVSTIKAPVPSVTSEEAMPKGWFFDIYEDTAEEEAANMMEHSTLTLDLSSDDESSVKARSDRGKENIAPEGYDAPTASRPAPVAAPAVVSVLAEAAGKSTAAAATPVDGALSDDVKAAIDAVFPAKTAMKKAVVDAPRRRKLHADAMDDGLRAPLSELETEPVDILAKADAKGEIVIWED